ncbi:MAG: hypothetical protein FWF19_00880 [Euryarchaeota archaeon]|nr:hypothetical protein [Euryarchaeota archaeon]
MCTAPVQYNRCKKLALHGIERQLACMLRQILELIIKLDQYLLHTKVIEKRLKKMKLTLFVGIVALLLLTGVGIASAADDRMGTQLSDDIFLFYDSADNGFVMINVYHNKELSRWIVIYLDGSYTSDTILKYLQDIEQLPGSKDVIIDVYASVIDGDTKYVRMQNNPMYNPKLDHLYPKYRTQYF